MPRNSTVPKNCKLLVLLTCALFLSVTAIGQTKKDSLIVFVGEKLSVRYFPEEESRWIVDSILINETDTVVSRHLEPSMDSRYQAKYRILELVHGAYQADTIEFTAYVHEGGPAFAQFNHVLLFLSYSNGKLYHEKYQYFDVYKAKNGRWASPYPAADYNHPYRDSISVKPEKISFTEGLKFSLKLPRNFYMQRSYPPPFYKIQEEYAAPVFGNYVEDLFKLKMETTLKARGIY